jgi:hypothetical protein
MQIHEERPGRRSGRWKEGDGLRQERLEGAHLSMIWLGLAANPHLQAAWRILQRASPRSEFIPRRPRPAARKHDGPDAR